ncbi:DUF3810 domain-containing protein [Paraflavisolibacter sp. H34]|uniref:DUF3810 domain-containing protein n=1 Tax=Huijunlia imazamoxiresistens TaxID=3127457 RepID=UPI003018AF1E
MIRSILRDKILVALLSVAALIKLLSLNAGWVERYYTYGFYPKVAAVLRLVFGWVPVSVGDLLYGAAFFYLVAKAGKLIGILGRRQVKEYLSLVLLKKFLRLVTGIYLVFNIFWGLNYNRQGVARQLGLQVAPYSVQDLDTLTTVLLQRLNACAARVNPGERSELESNRLLFEGGMAAFREAEKELPFLALRHPSIKPSVFSSIGHFFGFTGYYNPFTGEAQIKTSIPAFIKPFVVTHEIGHQLGYAKENEANFAAYLACRRSASAEFRYSVYYELYRYAIGEMNRRDTLRAQGYLRHLHPQVVADNLALINYFLQTDNAMEPVVSSLYDEFLRWNSQPKGKMTYNEVISWLIAYGKKYGMQSI